MHEWAQIKDMSQYELVHRNLWCHNQWYLFDIHVHSLTHISNNDMHEWAQIKDMSQYELVHRNLWCHSQWYAWMSTIQRLLSVDIGYSFCYTILKNCHEKCLYIHHKLCERVFQNSFFCRHPIIVLNYSEYILTKKELLTTFTCTFATIFQLYRVVYLVWLKSKDY